MALLHRYIFQRTNRNRFVTDELNVLCSRRTVSRFKITKNHSICLQGGRGCLGELRGLPTF